MISPEKIEDIINNEVRFTSSKSGGPGGQHANKVNTKVELRFNIYYSNILNLDEKQLITERLEKRLTKNKELILYASTARSQIQNKHLVIERFINLIQSCLIKQRARKATKPGKLSIERRLKEKQKKSFKKQLRIKPDINHE